jgi:hypothetical protein
MRVVVARIGPDGAMNRRTVDTAASSDAGPWEDLIARALASPPPYRPVPGDPVYHLRVDEQVVLVAEHDLSGSLFDLVTAVLALGEALHGVGGQPAALLGGVPWTTRAVPGAGTADLVASRPLPAHPSLVNDTYPCNRRCQGQAGPVPSSLHNYSLRVLRFAAARNA